MVTTKAQLMKQGHEAFKNRYVDCGTVSTNASAVGSRVENDDDVLVCVAVC